MSATVYRRPWRPHPKRRWLGGLFFASFRGFLDEPSPSGGAGPDTVSVTVLPYVGASSGGAAEGIDQTATYDQPSPRFG